MLKSKKILSTLLAFVMCVSVGTTAFAEDLRSVGAEKSNVLIDSNTDISGEHVLTPEEYNLYLQGLSEDEQNKINAKLAQTQKDEQNRINAKLAETQKDANQSLAKAAATGTKISVPGTFTMYQQETGTYCIPATIKSMLMYINGSSPSQSTIASTTEQDPTKIAPYLNDRQDECYYIYVGSPSQSSMCSSLYSTICTQAPGSMGISGTTTSNWYYATSGHSLVVNAIYDDYSYIQFGDPLGDLVAGCPYFYLKSASVSNSVCTRIVY